MNDSFEYRVPGADLLPLLKVAKVMGYADHKIPEPFSSLVDEAMADAAKLLDPKAEINILEGPRFDRANHTMMLQGSQFHLQKVVYNMVKKSTSVAFFICTIGHALPAVISKKSAEGDLLSAYVYDIIGTLSVDAAMDVFQSRIKNEMADRQLNITNRYSPGYCNWDIQEQQLLFKFIPGDFTGVNLSASCLMQPIKSISGIFGIGANVKFNPYTCSRCDQKDCLYASVKSESMESGNMLF